MIQVMQFVFVLCWMAFSSVILWVYYSYLHRMRFLPNGPLNLPIFGSFVQIFCDIDYRGIGPLFLKWSKVYGPVFSVFFGWNPVIVINDARIARRAFKLEEFSGRPMLPGLLVRVAGSPKGLVSNQGDCWAEQHNFTSQWFNNLSIEKEKRRSVESLIVKEVREVIRLFQENLGKPTSTNEIFNFAVVNILWTLVASEEFKHNNTVFPNIVLYIKQSVVKSGRTGAMVYMPTIAKLFPEWSGWSAYLKSAKATRYFFQFVVKNRLRTLRDRPRNDFMNDYIAHIKLTTDPNSSFYKEEGEQNLAATLNDLFNGGGESTSTVMSWFILCLALNPNVQKRLHAEIDNVLGREKMVTLADRPRMMYMEAILSEVFRISSVVSVTVPHSCLQNLVMEGFPVKKDTIVLSNIFGIHNDPATWKNPQKFDPSRFLDKNRTRNYFRLMPFSTGRRPCPAESVARNEIFIMMIAIFQVFEVTLDPMSPTPSLIGHCDGIINKPPEHFLIFHPR